MRYGFTGSRYLEPTHHALLDEVLHAHLDGEEYTTGGAAGVDTYVLRRMTTLCPEALHRVCVPEAGLGWENPYLNLASVVEQVPDTMRHPYRSRNLRILVHTDVLLAFPLREEDHPKSKRSGTWMTIRMARERGYKVITTVLGYDR